MNDIQHLDTLVEPSEFASKIYGKLVKQIVKALTDPFHNFYNNEVFVDMRIVLIDKNVLEKSKYWEPSRPYYVLLYMHDDITKLATKYFTLSWSTPSKGGPWEVL
jgi:hypothetical protein